MYFSRPCWDGQRASKQPTSATFKPVHQRESRLPVFPLTTQAISWHTALTSTQLTLLIIASSMKQLNSVHAGTSRDPVMPLGGCLGDRSVACTANIQLQNQIWASARGHTCSKSCEQQPTDTHVALMKRNSVLDYAPTVRQKRQHLDIPTQVLHVVSKPGTFHWLLSVH